MRQRRLKNEINVVPYIDVMLVLLVIFMVATPMMTTGSVDLPAAGTAPQKPDKYVKVQIKEDGSLSLFDVDGKERSLKGLKELKSELLSLQAADAKMPILIAGDKEAPYRNVIEVLDEAKRAGFQKVGLETAAK
ncbi:MAG: protein TolR [Betaproteobacteria bacterium HGW-Betaproteobacteria-7]|jgi:biopolymer transport protein TolR|nr:MAG: protein TolR [Betaproteobacteria bacterium HGW-Betaproteobacteria-7]